MAVEHASADHALRKLRQKSHEPRHPQLKVRERHPQHRAAQLLQNRQAQTKHCVARLTVGHQLVEQLGNMRQRRGPRITHLGGHRRLDHFAGVEPRQFLALAVVVKRPHIGERLKSASEAASGLHGRARHAFHLAFHAGKERDQQVGLAQRIRAQNDRFRLLQRHGRSTG